MREYK